MSCVLEMSSLSKNAVQTQVSASTGQDPSVFPVKFAFVELRTEPEPGDWVAGEWVVQNDASGTVYWATIRVGPDSDFELANGRYSGWVWVDATLEDPKWEFVTLVIT